MKRMKVSPAIIALLVMILAATSISCSKKGGKITNMISKDAQLVVIAPNVGRFVKDLGSLTDWLQTKAPMLGMIKQQMVASLGVDITNPEELGKNGINPDGGFALVMINLKDSAGYALLPVKDEKAFIAFFNEMRKKNGKPEIAKEGDFYSVDEGSYLTFKKGFAVLGDNQELLKKVGEGESIGDSKSYKDALKNIGDNRDLIVYLSPEVMKEAAKAGAAAEQEAKAIQDIANMYGAMTFGLSFNKSDIEAKSYVEITDMAKVKKILSTSGASEMIAKFPSGASVLARAHINLPEMWAMMKDLSGSNEKSKKEMEATLAQAQQALGMDLEKDIIANLEGNPALAFYGMTAGQSPMPDMLVTVTVKDEGKIKEALEKLRAMMAMGAPPKNTKLSGMGIIEISPDPSTTIYLAVAHKNLIVAMSPERIMTVVSGSAGSNNASSSVAQADAKKKIEDKDVDVLYVDIPMLLESLKKTMSPEEAQMINMYVAQAGGLASSYVLIESGLAENGMIGSIKIHLGD